MSHFIYDKASVGERIRIYRTALHLTQEQLAEKLDKSWRFVNNLERGAVGMSMETLLALCGALKTTPNHLLLFDGDPADDGGLKWAMDALAHAPASVRDTAVEILRAYLRGA